MTTSGLKKKLVADEIPLRLGELGRARNEDENTETGSEGGVGGRAAGYLGGARALMRDTRER